jgi:DNA invertase Pin-like site-specific DNA recombinase
MVIDAGTVKVFAEKVSGEAAKRVERKALDRAIAALEEGDTLVVTGWRATK